MAYDKYDWNMIGYINQRLNHLLNEGKRLHSSDGGVVRHTEYGCLQIGFVRKEEWDCEKFDEILNVIADSYENGLNAVKSGTRFTITIRMIHDKVHKDGLTRKFVVGLDWEPTGICPFEVFKKNLVKTTLEGERKVCDDDDSDDGF
jgi:hypothetical protein